MEPTAHSLARTYSERVYADPWEKVRDYRRVVAYAADHPDAGRVRVGNALALPPSRVRGWLNDAVPDPVRGINTAIDHGWLDPDPESDTAAALVELLAHVLAGGCITRDTFGVAVTPGQRVDSDEIRDAFERVGVETTLRHAESSNRATEIVPRTDASVLGRCLVAMGAPQGAKTALDAIPPVVWAVPPDVRDAFTTIYVRHRALSSDRKATLWIQEQRPRSYLDDLQQLVSASTEQPVTVSDRAVTISADAARALEIR